MEKRVDRRATAEDRRLMEVEPGTRIIALSGIHFAGDRPFCLEERRINASLVPEAAAADFSTTAPGRWLLAQVPWSEAEHRIHAAAAGPALAERLGVARGTACLVVERRTWSSLGPITWVRFTYRGDSHTLVARFTPANRSYV
jgi:GntR family histidine utilization transcriptional repressor